MAENPIITEFARLLRDADEQGRKRLLSSANMLAMSEITEEGFEPPVSTLGEYLDTEIPIPPSLVWPTIAVRGEITATLGRAGKGKTTMNLNRILKWSAGKPMFEDFKDPDADKDGKHKTYLAPDGPLKTLIIENEGNAGMFHQKMGMMLNNGGVFSEEERELVRENVYIWGNGGYSGLKLDDPVLLNQVRAGIEKCNPDIVFIEPFRSLWKGDENSSTDMAAVVDNIVAAATDYECAVILSHHERKSGAGEDGEEMSAGRGSTVLEGVVAVMENFKSVKGGDARELSWSKARYLNAPIPARMSWVRDSGWYEFVPVTDIEAQVMECIREAVEPINVTAIAEELDEKSGKLRPILAGLKKANRVKELPSVSNGQGTTGKRYRLLSGGEDDEGSGGLGI